jgi:hypothetical protein
VGRRVVIVIDRAQVVLVLEYAWHRYINKLIGLIKVVHSTINADSSILHLNSKLNLLSMKSMPCNSFCTNIIEVSFWSVL